MEFECRHAFSFVDILSESWKLDYAGPASKAKFLSFAAFICRLMMIIIAGERWEFREALCVISPMSGI